MVLFLTLACVLRAEATPKLSILKALLSDHQHTETPQVTGCFPFQLGLPSTACMPRAAQPCASCLLHSWVHILHNTTAKTQKSSTNKTGFASDHWKVKDFESPESGHLA